MTTTTARRLTGPEITRYREQGYLMIENVLTAAELTDLDAALHRRWLAYRQRLAETVDQRLVEERENQLHGLGADFPPARRLAGDERILALIEDLVGPGIGLFSAKMISKGPNQPDNVCHWHQDDAYWWERSQSGCRLSVWIPLKDAGPHNGGLRVVPGDHRRAIVGHLPRDSRDHGACRLSFRPGEDRIEGERQLEVPAGAVVLFGARTFHASHGNHSDDHRRAFILTYQEAASAGKPGEATVLRPA